MQTAATRVITGGRPAEAYRQVTRAFVFVAVLVGCSEAPASLVEPDLPDIESGIHDQRERSLAPRGAWKNTTRPGAWCGGSRATPATCSARNASPLYTPATSLTW